MSAGGLHVETGRPPVADTVALLDEAYDGWGSVRRFEWLCDHPEGAHHWWTADGDDLVGYDAAYDRTIRGRDGDLAAPIRANFAVARDRQGEGIGTPLLDAVDDYVADSGAAMGVKYVTTDNLTFDQSQSDGFAWRRLPLYVRLLSPTAAIAARAGDSPKRVNADGLLDDDGALRRLAVGALGLVDLRVGDGRLNLGATLDRDGDGSRSGVLTVPLSEGTVTGLVEAASADRYGTEFVATTLRAVADRKLAAVRDAGTADAAAHHVERVGGEEPIPDADLDRLLALYESVHAGYEFHFSRREADVRHLLAHPELAATVWVARDGTLVGFAALRWEAASDLDELRALDLVAVDDAAHARLVEAVEATGDALGADLVATLSDRDPGPRWARVRKHVLMWRPVNGPESLRDRLRTADLRMGLYDVQ